MISEKGPIASVLKRWIRRFLAAGGLEIMSMKAARDLRGKAPAADDMRLLLASDDMNATAFIRALKASRSQIRQDLFVLSQLSFKRGGFFVEFGATDGVSLSNTFLLEKEFGWRGILAEPAKCWHTALSRNRDAVVDHRCVWHVSGAVLSFSESIDAEYSTISEFKSRDSHHQLRRNAQTYEVDTVSLTEMLDYHGAPAEIDYLSIDTEGSEYDILRSLDFDKYKFNIITCEHNYTVAREKIFHLLSSKGYRRVFMDISRFDDWYVLEGCPAFDGI